MNIKWLLNKPGRLLLAAYTIILSSLLYSIFIEKAVWLTPLVIVTLIVFIWCMVMSDDEDSIEESKVIGKYVEGLLKRDPDLVYDKPCHALDFCPYGALVEEFPLKEVRDESISCKVFGHDCPVFYCGSPFAEDLS